MENAKLGKDGYALIIIYFLSLDKPEFTEYAKKISAKSERMNCFNVTWWIVMDMNMTNPDYQKLFTFFRENCKRNNWDLIEWLKTQSEV